MNTKRKPNIIFILIDDLGWRDLACYGSRFYETPNLDRLASGGMRFTDAYAACPVCSPTRASLLTGKYPATVGVTDWIDWGGNVHPLRGRLVDVPYLKELPRDERTVARVLRKHGYATWHVGKWHLGGKGHLPTDHGFEVNIGGCQMGSPGRGGYFSPWTITGLENAQVPDGTYLTDYLTDQALDLISHSLRIENSRPYFLNLWYYSVHTPLQAKKEKIEKYEKKARELRLDTETALIEGEYFPTQHKKHLRVTRRVIQSDPVYAAMIESLDENIGRILKFLDDTGELDDTIIIFTSDNGGLSSSEGSPTCNRPLAEGKGWMYDGGVREPLIVHWPAVVSAGSTCAEPVSSPDFFPTILEMAKVQEPPEPVDGVSLVPLLRGFHSLNRRAIFWHYPHYGNQGGTPGSSIRSGEYKLIEFFEDGRLELYNLREDIQEEHNLIDEEPQTASLLHELLAEWRKEVAAKIPHKNDAFA